MNIVHRTSFLVALLTICVSHSAHASDLPPFPFLIVEGKAVAEVPPDTATLTLRVVAFDAQSDVAVDTVQKQIIELLRTLAKFSIPDDAITSFDLAKRIERDRKGKTDEGIAGYFVTRRVDVEIADLSQFSALITAIARLDNVSSLDARFDITDRKSVQRRLINEAGADARRRAGDMVGAMSRSIGDVYAISESSIRSSVARFSLGEGRNYALAMAAPRANYQDTIFVPATIDLRQSIHVMFELE